MFQKHIPHGRIATAGLVSRSSLGWESRPNAWNPSVDAHGGENLRFDHVIVWGVEDVAADDPHDLLVHHGLVGSPGQPGVGVLLPAPEGGVGRHGDSTVWTWGGKETTESGLHRRLNDASSLSFLHLCMINTINKPELFKGTWKQTDLRQTNKMNQHKNKKKINFLACEEVPALMED